MSECLSAGLAHALHSLLVARPVREDVKLISARRHLAYTLGLFGSALAITMGVDDLGERARRSPLTPDRVVVRIEVHEAREPTDPASTTRNIEKKSARFIQEKS